MATASAASVGRRHGPVDEAVAWILNVHKIGESDPAAAAELHRDAAPRMRRWTEPPYRSHKAAIHAFHDEGIHEAEVVPDFLPGEFKAALQELLDSVNADIRVVDLSATLPTVPNGSLAPTIKAIGSAKLATNRRNNIVFMLARTRETTPAFVHLCAYAEQLARPGAAPLPDVAFGVLLFHGRHEYAMPARICCTKPRVAAECVATLMQIGFHGFACVVCNVPLGRWLNVENRLVHTFDRHIVTDCGHLYHTDCAVKQLFRDWKEHGGDASSGCVACGAPHAFSFMQTKDSDAPDTNGSLTAAMPRAAAAAAAAPSSRTAAAKLAAAHRATYNAVEMARVLKNTGLSVAMVTTNAPDEAPERIGGSPDTPSNCSDTPTDGNYT